MSDFARLGVPQTFSDALARLGITSPTPIQAATLPDGLAGRDVLGRGRTGSGKTYAFLLPLVTRLAARRTSAAPKRPRALVLAPTRELAQQIEESLVPLADVAGLSHRTIFGGVNQNPQVRDLGRGVDVVVACPGRLLDLMDQGAVDLRAVEVTVIDEADQMADMGFLPMVSKILNKTSPEGQRLLFSATLDSGVNTLVKRFLHDPVVHEADSAQATVATMDHHVLEVAAADRTAVLADLAAAPGKTIVFTRTKYGAKKLTKQLVARGVAAVELHGNLAQNARTRNMDAFHSGRVSTLVATDIAARGIHVDDVGLVVHADPPAEHKAYLHRSGRTARAGKAGTVITMATKEQLPEVRQLMRAAHIHATRGVADAQTLGELAPGERSYLDPAQAKALAQPVVAQAQAQRQPAPASGRPRQARSGGHPRGAAAKQPRSGQPRGASGKKVAGQSRGEQPAARGAQRSRPAEQGRSRRSGRRRSGTTTR
ncbi:DEAD/DEAH box helicase [Nigerium massiliense]|uniref:DEAD/DEAH box helicase n=1 Tax=Nigerium massiliense TaxID=1522317 RepID=UPI000694D551|nr:DEAD/DEAH box helicase [Nigerium massiliense]